MRISRSHKLIIIVVLVALLASLPMLLLSFYAPIRTLALSATKCLYEVQRRYMLERYLIDPDFAFIAEVLICTIPDLAIEPSPACNRRL